MTIHLSRCSSLVALALASILVAGPAQAGKDDHRDGDRHGEQHGKKDKHDKHEKHEKHGKRDKHADKHRDRDDVKVGHYFNDQQREAARAYYIQQYGHGRRCPPGLAKKNNGCMPPGQVRYVVGQPLPRTVTVYQVPQPVVTQLPVAPPGYRYVRVGNDILLVSPQTQMVVDVIDSLLR